MLRQLFCLLAALQLVSASINMTTYFQMPPLYLVDDYVRCMEEFPKRNSTFCYVDVSVKPNRTSNLWNEIEMVSRSKYHYYRHDRLHRGICMNWCNSRLSGFTNETLLDLNTPYFDPNTTEKLDTSIYPTSKYYRDKYGTTINQCINMDLWSKHQLQGYSDVEFCINSSDKQFSPDIWDSIFFFVTSWIFKFVVSGTYYDFKWKRAKQKKQELTDREYYMTPVSDKRKQFVVSFSVMRNWYRFMRAPPSKEFSSLSTMKFLLTYTVICGHITSLYKMFPTENTYLLENNSFSIWAPLFMNSHITIQAFLTTGAFLMGYQFAEFRKKEMECNFHFFWQGIVFRVLRFMPLLAWVTFYHATWGALIITGPLANVLSIPEKHFCRKNWWVNLLFLNNYIRPDEPCVQQSWYLSTYLQLYIIALLFLMISWKYPKSKYFLLTIAVLASTIIPGVVTYVNKFDGIFVQGFEARKYRFRFDDMFKYFYIPTHTNFGCFLAGILGGWVYSYLKGKNVDLKKSKIFNVIWWLNLLIAFLFSFSSALFYMYDFQKPAIWIAVYAGFSAIFWGASLCVFLIGCAQKCGWLIYQFFSLRIFHYFNKLTFVVFMTHPLVLSVLMFGSNKPLHLSLPMFLVLNIAVFVASYAFGLYMHLTFEAPFEELLKMVLARPKVKTESEETKVEAFQKEVNGKNNLELNKVKVIKL